LDEIRNSRVEMYKSSEHSDFLWPKKQIPGLHFGLHVLECYLVEVGFSDLPTDIVVISGASRIA
jgi:hypothetical protein